MAKSSGGQRSLNFGEPNPRAAANATPLTIRPAAPADVPAMAAIRAEEWETQEFWQTRISAYLTAKISARQALPESATFVAAVDGAVVGFVAGHRTTRHNCQGELQWINVARRQRGRGIAARLVATMAGWFVEQQALRVCVDVVPENTAARGLYAKHGAVDLKPNWMVWEDIRTALAGSDSATTFGV